MRILVWGLGYVGTVSAACLARLGHEVIGVEPNPAKVEGINSGRCLVREPGLDALVAEVVAQGHLRAVTSGTALVASSDVSFICVGTPSAADGQQSLDYLKKVAADLGAGLRLAERRPVVVLRSTVVPGTTRSLLVPLLEEHSGRRSGEDFGVVSNPEFLREASAIADFRKPPYTVIGEIDRVSGDLVESIYAGIGAPVFRVALEEAELLKLVNNAFHALKVGFANEIGRYCEALGVDGSNVMRMVCADTKLNISPAYLKPGFAFGGSCLPKDLRALTRQARRLGVGLPILDAVLPSNQLQVDAARVTIHELGARAVAILGVSFKPGTDDMRESPVISLIRDLWQDGIDVTVHDPDVELEQMLGTNREYLERQLPQISRIFRPRLADALEGCDVVVVTQGRPEFWAATANLPPTVHVVDLVGGRAPSGRTIRQEASWSPDPAHAG